MTVNFLSTLSESRLYPSTASLKRYTPRQVADVAYLTIIALRILFEDKDTKKWAEVYARHTARHGDFDSWFSDATDLHIALYALLNDVDLHITGNDLRDSMHINEHTIIQWLQAEQLDKPGHEHLTRVMFLRLDGFFKVKDVSMQSIRRLVQDWPNLDIHGRKLAMTRLLQMFRAHAPKSEVLHGLELIADHKDLEFTDVCDPETGHGCGKASTHHFGQTEEPKKHSFLRSLGTLAGGAAMAYGIHKIAAHMREEADGGATVAGDIASVIAPLGTVRRRTSIYPAGAREPRKKR